VYTPLAMQVSLEHRPGSVVELSIEVPTEQVEAAIRRAFDRLSPRVRVAGFRPGRAPREILEREIGWPALREQALEILLPETLTRAVADNNLEAIENPRVEVETFERLQPARFKAVVTVKPEVVLGNVTAIKAPLKEAVVGSDRVDAAIEEIREGFATLVPAENRPVRDKDHLVVDLEVRKDGMAVDEQPTSNLEIDVSSDNLLPGLFDGLEGMNQGDSKEIPVHLPDDYRRTDLAGHDVVFAVAVKEIKEHQLPDLDDELARLSGIAETLDELRVKVEERLRVVAERDAIFEQQKAALDALIASSKFEVPEVIVNDELDREMRNLAISLGQQGIDFEQLVRFGGANLEQMREERRPAARERAAQELVLDALADQQGFYPSEEHVDSEANRVLADAEDADRLRQSDRLKAYVGERIRLQWALLWLAATARGDDWTPPPPGVPVDELGPAAASEELVSGGSAGVLEQAPAAGVPAGPLPDAGSEAKGEEGMVDI
jgi:trigger factor